MRASRAAALEAVHHHVLPPQNPDEVKPGGWAARSALDAIAARCVRMRLPSPEQPLDVGELQLDIGRAAVVARCRSRASPPSGAAARSSLRPQAPAGAHRAVAGHGRGDAVEPLLQRVDRVVVGDLVGEVARPAGATLVSPSMRRRLAHGDRARAEAARCRGRSATASSACRRGRSASSSGRSTISGSSSSCAGIGRGASACFSAS